MRLSWKIEMALRAVSGNSLNMSPRVQQSQVDTYIPARATGGLYSSARVGRFLQVSAHHPHQHFYPTQIEHISSLDVLGSRAWRRKTGIICTIGPASRDVETLVQMMESGMNIARLNFSHGTAEYHLGTIDNIRKANEIFNQKVNRTTPIGIALDTKGPEIRTGLVKGGVTAEVQLSKADEVTLTTDVKYFKEVTASLIYVDYKNMPKIVTPNAVVYIDDGLISLRVLRIEGDKIICRVENGGNLGSTKGVNLPGTEVDLPALSEKDKNDILFARENQLDIIFASFIRNKEAVEEIKELTSLKGDKSLEIAVIAKIENEQGVDNVDDIISVADGLMVARGDLGIELPAERIFLAQKSMIAKCNLAGKPVICATQMLESMITKPRPTRAETSDVANAILDGADCVMLSGETAKGKYPVECVRVMSKVCREAEAAVAHRQLFIDLSKMVHPPAPVDVGTAIAGVAAAEKSMATAIILITSSGRTAYQLAMFRPICPIIAVTMNLIIARKCHLFRGVVPIYLQATPITDWAKDTEYKTKIGIQSGHRMGIISEGDSIIVLTGWKAGSGSTNTMKIVRVTKDLLKNEDL